MTGEDSEYGPEAAEEDPDADAVCDQKAGALLERSHDPEDAHDQHHAE